MINRFYAQLTKSLVSNFRYSTQNSKRNFHRNTWIQVNLDAVRNNVQVIKNRLPKGTGIYAVVKANAYGNGVFQVAREALNAGSTALAVATFDQALQLRYNKFSQPILVMGWSSPQNALLASQLNISLSAFQKDWFIKAKSYLGEKPLNIHLCLDTGMGRIGIRQKQQLQQVLQHCKQKPFMIEGIFTHFSTSDEKNTQYYQQQNKKFKWLLNYIPSQIKDKAIIHTGNSGAAMRFPDQMYNYIRYGISLYGYYASQFVKEQKPVLLRPILSLYSKISHVKLSKKGDFISYARTYQCQQDQWIATLPIGYGDGYRRDLQGQQVLIDGKRMPNVGRICMDQIMVRLDQYYPVGQLVTLIGQQKGQQISIDELAKKSKTINYEISCGFSKRVPRVYIRDDKKYY